MAAALKKELSSEVCFSSSDGRSGRESLSLHASSSPLFWRVGVYKAALRTPRRVSTHVGLSLRILEEKNI